MAEPLAYEAALVFLDLFLLLDLALEKLFVLKVFFPFRHSHLHLNIVLDLLVHLSIERFLQIYLSRGCLGSMNSECFDVAWSATTPSISSMISGSSFTPLAVSMLPRVVEFFLSVLEMPLKAECLQYIAESLLCPCGHKGWHLNGKLYFKCSNGGKL